MVSNHNCQGRPTAQKKPPQKRQGVRLALCEENCPEEQRVTPLDPSLCLKGPSRRRLGRSVIQEILTECIPSFSKLEAQIRCLLKKLTVMEAEQSKHNVPRAGGVASTDWWCFPRVGAGRGGERLHGGEGLLLPK